MTLVPAPAGTVAGLVLSDVQTRSLTAAAERMSAAGSPMPDSVRQDTAGTVHLTWLVLGCRVIVNLTSGGSISSEVTMRASQRVSPTIVAFQVQLQEFFAL